MMIRSGAVTGGMLIGFLGVVFLIGTFGSIIEIIACEKPRDCSSVEIQLTVIVGLIAAGLLSAAIFLIIIGIKPPKRWAKFLSHC